MTVSDEILKRSADAYRRIRNTARFLLSNLNGFEPAQHAVASDDMVELDRWIVGRAKALQDEIIDAYDNYQFLSVTQKLMHFCSIELGSFYLDIIKDRQYTAKKDSVAQRSCQTALWHIAEALVRWMAPITSFTAQEIWELMPSVEGRERYVFTAEWYQAWPQLNAQTKLTNDDWQQLLAVRGEVNRALEQARREERIGGSLQANVTLYVSDALNDVLVKLKDELRFVLLTSHADTAPLAEAPADALATELEALKVVVLKSAHTKCARCWHHREEVGTIAEHPELCGRCVTNVDGEGEVRHFA